MICPNKSLQDWDKLVDELGVQGAYFTFIKNGNKVPYIQNRESNRLIWDVENEMKLVTWENVGNKNIKKHKGFDRETAAKLIDDIRNKYVGDFTVTQGTPEDNKGEFSIVVKGMPLDKKLWDEWQKETEEDYAAYSNFKRYQEFKFLEEEANEHILPLDSGMKLYDDTYEHRAISPTRLLDKYDVEYSNDKLGNLRKITVTDPSKGDSKSIAMLTVRESEEYPGYKSIKILFTNEEYRGQGIATSLYKLLVNQLGDSYKGFVSPAESRQNKKQVPYIHDKIATELDRTILPNGDILFTKKDFINIDRYTFEKQKELLAKTMPYIDRIIEDRSIPQRGYIHVDEGTIVVNPDLMTKDTLGHEYGHLLIDLRGGMEDPFILEGYNQLIDTPAYKTTYELYPELILPDGTLTNRFKEEVLANAIGMEVADLFDDVESSNKFAKWLMRFFRWLESRLGISKSNARELARQLVGESPIPKMHITSSITDYIQEQRVNIDSNKPETISNAIRNLSNQFRFEAEEHKYFYGTEEFKPVSTLMHEYGYGISKEDENETIIAAQRIGTTIHANAESLSNGVEAIVETNTGYDFTKKAQDDLKGILNQVFGDKYTLLNEVIIGDPEAGIAGTADTVAIDNSGNVYIFDYKTSTNTKGGFKYYDKGYQGKKSKRETNTMQLSLYKEILKNTLGIKVKELNIVPIVADVNQYNKIIGLSVDNQHALNGIIRLNFDPKAVKVYNTQRTIFKAKDNVEKGDLSEEEFNSMTETQRNILDYQSAELNEIESIRSRAEELISTRLRTLQHKGNVADLGNMNDLLDTLIDEKIEHKRAVLQFVASTVGYINNQYDFYQKLLKKDSLGDKKALSTRYIYRMYDIMSAYDILDDVGKYIITNGNVLDKSTTAKMLAQLNMAIAKKNVIRDLYQTKGVEKINESLNRYSTLVIGQTRELKKKEWLSLPKEEKSKISIEDYAENYIKANISDITEESKALFAKELQVASDDIGYVRRWLDTILDTNDMVIAAVVKKIVVADREARQESIDFRDGMIPILRDMEKQIGYNHYTDPITKLYDFMLEKDIKGNYTGSMVSKFSSALMEEYQKILDKTELLPKSERWQERNAWKEANMPMNKVARNIALTNYINELVNEDLLDEEEASDYWKEQEVPFKNRRRTIDIVNQDAANLIEEWLQANSMSFRNPIDKWASPQYGKLLDILKNENDPRTKFYNYIRKSISDIDSAMPYEKKLYDKLPYVTKTSLERFQSGQSIAEITKDNLAKTFQKHTDDLDKGSMALTNEKGDPIDFIPTHYHRTSTYDVANQSFDLSTIYYLYHRMASNYKHKLDVHPEAELVKIIAENREYAVTDNSGNPIKKILSRAREKELTKTGSKALIVDMYSDFLKTDMYGKKQVDEGDLHILGYSIDKAKAANLIGKYTAFNLLGLNLIQGISNVNIGEINQVIEALSGEYFTVKDLNKATGEYLKNLHSTAGDIGNRVRGSKINALAEKFDILNEYEGGEFRKNSRFAQLTLSDALFFASHIGEHFMQTRVMIAMLGKIKAFDKSGKEIGSMYDMYSINKDGRLVLSDKVDREQSNWSMEQEILAGEKIKRLLARIHGEYGSVGRSAIQQYALGRLAIMFRKFMVPGFKRRWEKKRHNEFLEEFTEGSYREFGNYVKNLAIATYKLKFDLISEAWTKLLPREKANVKRAVFEATAMISMIIMATVFLSLKGDADDDGEEMLYANLAYVALRGRSELAFFYNPIEAQAILRSPAASLSAIENAGKFFGMLLPPDFSGFETYERGPWKGNKKIAKAAVNMTPGIRQIYRIRDAEEMLKLFER